MKNHLILGDWNALCDSCGRKFKASSLQKRWDGLIVCKEDWEQRHPQDLLRVQREQISVPWSRPYPAEDTYITKFGLVDNVQTHDYHEEGDYVDAGYFLSVYISDFYIVTTWARSFSDQVSVAEQFVKTLKPSVSDTVSLVDSVSILMKDFKTITDTASLADSGNVLIKNYIDPTYFAADYVGTSTTF